MHVFWDLTPDARFRIEAVYRLSSVGALATHTVEATSREGFSVESRLIEIFIIEGEQFNRWELFDETDLDAALARFEELQPQTRRLENAASQVIERFFAYFGARDWDATAAILCENVSHDDRRHVVNAGFYTAETPNRKSARDR